MVLTMSTKPSRETWDVGPGLVYCWANVVDGRPNAGLLLDQRRRQWDNSKPTLGRRLMLAGLFNDFYLPDSLFVSGMIS